MRRFVVAITIASLFSVTGCNSRPDPKANPNFNEAALENPGAIKMEPINPKKK